MMTGRTEEALVVAQENAEDGRRIGDADVETLSRMTAGQALIALGRPADALAQLDQVILAVEGPDLTPPVAGMAYCAVIAACLHLSELDRARTWTAALSSWCDTTSGEVPYRGLCLVHRSQLMPLHGEWPQALAEAQDACARSSGPPLGEALYQLGEVHRLAGRLAETEDCFRRANSLGRQPEPGLSLLRLAQGQTETAARTMRALFAEQGRTDRLELLGATVEVAVAAATSTWRAPQPRSSPRLPRPQACPSSWLGRTRRRVACSLRRVTPVRRSHAFARRSGPGSVSVSPTPPRGRGPCSAMLCDAIGDGSSAAAEYDAAREAFGTLGAGPDLTRLAATRAHAGGLTAREVEVLRLVAAGGTNRDDRGRARAQREDRGPPPLQHLRASSASLASRRDGVRLRARARLATAHEPPMLS